MTQPARSAQHRGRWWAAARAHALSAATLHSLPVFPLARSKFPAIPTAHPDSTDPCAGRCGRLGHGVHDASADPDQVKHLFAAAPWAAGYGIACGREPLNLFGLDLDRKNGVDGVTALRTLADRHGFTVPRTVTVATQSGGLHLWLTAPSGTPIPNTAGALGPGIDTRGGGGYLVGPGSLGPRGWYRFTTTFSHAEAASAPTAIIDLLSARLTAVQARPGLKGSGGGFGRSESRLDGLVRVVLNGGPGDRNGRLYWASRRAFENADIAPETAAARLLAASVENGHPEAEARRTLHSARRGTARSKEATS